MTLGGASCGACSSLKGSCRDRQARPHQALTLSYRGFSPRQRNSPVLLYQGRLSFQPSLLGWHSLTLRTGSTNETSSKYHFGKQRDRRTLPPYRALLARRKGKDAAVAVDAVPRTSVQVHAVYSICQAIRECLRSVALDGSCSIILHILPIHPIPWLPSPRPLLPPEALHLISSQSLSLSSRQAVNRKLPKPHPVHPPCYE